MVIGLGHYLFVAAVLFTLLTAVPTAQPPPSITPGSSPR